MEKRRNRLRMKREGGREVKRILIENEEMEAKV
jgi:hypothetical protein